GSALLMAMHHGLVGAGLWSEQRGDNLLDGGAPFYRCYRTADDRFVAVGALEPAFYAALLLGLDIDPATLPAQYDRSGWPSIAERLGAVFASRTRDHWTTQFAGTDACVVPVLTPLESVGDPHLRSRGTFIDVAGAAQPAPAPRFGRTPAALRPSDDPAATLRRFGLDADEAAALLGAS
ncbi:MAG TPA: CoA transferase, partial [Acidimicrobiia bacterium]|nr:CoA transferase [Acidimicrobiia bacterium]